jgi:hypothetical protein
LWKTLKAFLYEINGIDCRSPKQVIKEYYNLSYSTPGEYETQLKIIDDRNALSHIYNKDQFEEIYKRIVLTLSVFGKVLNEIEH